MKVIIQQKKNVGWDVARSEGIGAIGLSGRLTSAECGNSEDSSAISL